MKRNGWFERLKKAVRPTRDKFFERCSSLFEGFPDEGVIEELEEALIGSDVGVETTLKIISKVRGARGDSVLRLVKQEISSILSECSSRLKVAAVPPTVIMVIGVNGVGKTTSIAKLAHRFKGEGRQVILACGDTFRAAAADQLQTWAERLEVEMVSQDQGADSAAVVFDTLEAAKARSKDVAIIDTAGRLHTKINLIDELRKISRVCAKQVCDAPHEVLLVLDATFGQNGIAQAELFVREMGATGIILTKLDGTAKGGVVLAIADRLNIPVKLVGVGEDLEDLVDFSGEEFADALFGEV